MLEKVLDLVPGLAIGCRNDGSLPVFIDGLLVLFCFAWVEFQRGALHSFLAIFGPVIICVNRRLLVVPTLHIDHLA